jgi:hypothetical protein
MAEVITQQVLDAGRRAVWVVGGGHLSPPQLTAPADAEAIDPEAVDPGSEGVQVPLEEAPPSASALDRIEEAYPGAVFVATMYTGFSARTHELEAQLEEEVGGIEAPALLDLHGTWLGEDPAIELGSPNDTGDLIVDDADQTLTAESSNPPLAARQDALLWLGDCDSLSPRLPDESVFEDAAYRAELDRRVAISGLAQQFDVDGYFGYLTGLYGAC